MELVYGKKFKVEMDSSAVKGLLNKNQMGKFGRWILALQEYDFEIRHIRGVTNCGGRFVEEPSG